MRRPRHARKSLRHASQFARPWGRASAATEQVMQALRRMALWVRPAERLLSRVSTGSPNDIDDNIAFKLRANCIQGPRAAQRYIRAIPARAADRAEGAGPSLAVVTWACVTIPADEQEMTAHHERRYSLSPSPPEYRASLGAIGAFDLFTTGASLSTAPTPIFHRHHDCPTFFLCLESSECSINSVSRCSTIAVAGSIANVPAGHSASFFSSYRYSRNRGLWQHCACNALHVNLPPCESHLRRRLHRPSCRRHTFFIFQPKAKIVMPMRRMVRLQCANPP